jgi:hypothetical protein
VTFVGRKRIISAAVFLAGIKTAWLFVNEVGVCDDKRVF